MAEKKKASKKKPARDLTTKEVMRRVFPEEVRREAKKEVKEADQRGSRPDRPKSS